MTAAELKARDLVFKFMRYTPFEAEYELPYAKSCALIAVKIEYESNRELLFNLKSSKVIESDSIYLNLRLMLEEEEKQVKTEIEKL